MAAKKQTATTDSKEHATPSNGKHASGKVTQVIGPVVDIEFPSGEPPEVYTALKIKNPNVDQNDSARDLTVEVAQHLGERTVRCIAMDSTDGLQRGMSVTNTGAPIMMPVGKEVLGRILNVVGDPVDERGPVNANKFLPIHRLPPKFVDQSVKIEMFETGIKVIDLLAPYRRGGKIGLFGGAGVGKTVLIQELINNVAKPASASARAKATTCGTRWPSRSSRPAIRCSRAPR
jgi:F-type H+-transporting ATPase subunit beta